MTNTVVLRVSGGSVDKTTQMSQSTELTKTPAFKKLRTYLSILSNKKLSKDETDINSTQSTYIQKYLKPCAEFVATFVSTI